MTYLCLQELNRTCRQMQQRIVELLDKVANEEVTSKIKTIVHIINECDIPNQSIASLGLKDIIQCTRNTLKNWGDFKTCLS